MAPSTTTMKDISAKDPFFRLPSNVRQKIITNMDRYEWYDSLCKASVVMNHERHTNKLTICSDSVFNKFDQLYDRYSYSSRWESRWRFKAAQVRCLLSDGHLSEDDWLGYWKFGLVNPLFSTKPEIVYDMEALHGRFGDYLSLGPEIVRTFIERHADECLTHHIVKAYGKHGERFPTTYPLNKREYDHVTTFLILVDVMDVLALSGPTHPTIFYHHHRYIIEENNPASGFASGLALQIEMSVRDGIKAAAEEEELRKRREEKWEQFTKVVVTYRILDHGSDQATDEEGEEEWVFV
ncbi:uncharacterized protein FTJAE_4629 [Fusarium tjaetaba]|uniref:Uncharacterized protein n=1 Tax=Fusarium tjaetaba TaxID=1567544 RepID=A0A8H5VWH2_9HYPO|nr:uncharacterized protein FTJAE_4629 [Fusarium tjaetaba]KAF5640082.1 hypothetical protein FTJAE_4629 [Fusarium tjaetaba]